ncbi:MAG: DUF1801 domain-containing protein [Taibaiella sp.]|jgi:hypothetical protein
MKASKDILQFLAGYKEEVLNHALILRDIVLKNLPGITEQLDMPAKMIAYAYGQKYADLICVIIPSKDGLKLGFNKGSTLPDPSGILKGSGKISRYVTIKTEADIHNPAIEDLLLVALNAYKERTGLK